MSLTCHATWKEIIKKRFLYIYTYIFIFTFYVSLTEKIYYYMYIYIYIFVTNSTQVTNSKDAWYIVFLDILKNRCSQCRGRSDISVYRQFPPKFLRAPKKNYTLGWLRILLGFRRCPFGRAIGRKSFRQRRRTSHQATRQW